MVEFQPAHRRRFRSCISLLLAIAFAVSTAAPAEAKKKKKAAAAATPPRRLAIGKGNLPLKRLARTIFTKGFEGWVVLRLPADTGNPKADAQAALQYTENQLDLLF